MINFEQARANMVQRQIRTRNIFDPKILDLLLQFPREIFVPDNFKSLAYADMQLPIGHGQVMLSPDIIGKILAAVKLQGTETILEVGTGSGYLTGLLARLGRSVTSIETDKQLAMQANKRMQDLNLRNVEIIYGDAFTTLKGGKSFDVVIITGSVSVLPKSLINQTKINGCLFAVIGQEPVMQACIFTRIKEEEWEKTILFETVVPSLKERINAVTFEF